MTADEQFSYRDGLYRTEPCRPTWFARTFPSCSFYAKFAWNVYRSSAKARHGQYDNREWSRTSHKVVESLESVGVRVEFSGIENIRLLESPCVFIGNHMSMFETIVLPAIIQPVRDVTFVVKQSLVDYPVFRHIARSRDPIVVSRDNPREDFKAVMQGGIERLQQGISIVVFPQTTRARSFDPSQFNTIGVKLAARAKVPIVPIALKTDVWGNGKWIKDLGKIDPNKVAHIAFGEPIVVEGRGNDQHQRVIGHIESKLRQWNSEIASVDELQ